MKYLLLALVLLATPATAATSLYSIYAAGQYDEAIKAGVAANNAEGFAIAARAAMAQAALQASPCLFCLQRAEGFARQAIAADASAPDGHVWLAAALGMEGRILGLMKARKSAGEAMTHLDMALKADPRHAYALAAKGAWNIEIVRGGGAVLASMIYGAKEQDGLALFDRAVAVAPGNVAVRYQVGLTLSGYGPAKFRTRIENELNAAVTARPQTEYEKFIQSRAAQLLDLLKKNDTAALTAKVRIFQGYP